MEKRQALNGGVDPLIPNGVSSSIAATPSGWAAGSYTLSQFTITNGAPAAVQIEQLFMAEGELTVAQAFAASFWAAPPAPWTLAPGIDGTAPTAGTRVLLTA